MRAFMIAALAACGGDNRLGESTVDASSEIDATSEVDASIACGDGTCSSNEDWYSCNADCTGSCEGCWFSASYDAPDPCTLWSGCQRQATNRITGDASAREGSHAGRFEVRPGDFVNSGNRAEVVHCLAGGGCVGEAAGTERWYGWSTLWPTDFNSAPTWQLFTQWHHVGNSGSPPIELYVNGPTIYLRTSDAAGTGHVVHWMAPLETGRWRNFLFGVRFANDTSGWVELWLDGKQVLPRTAARTMIDSGNIFKQGLYRNATIDRVQVIFHDHMRKGSARDQVD
jgi:hypothetical protein